jgi:diguanylate cyclase (GGDEF)-like protein
MPNELSMRQRLRRRSDDPVVRAQEAAESEASDHAATSLRPFAAAAALAALATPIATTIQWPLYVAAIGFGVLAGALRLTRWHGRLDAVREVLPSLIFLVAVELMRSSAGGANSGIGIVALLPVFWTALHGDRRQLCLVVAAVALFFFAPLVLVGGPEYPASQYRAGVLFVAVSAIVGFTTQWLVSEVRFQASQAERREHDGRHLLARMSDMASTDSLTGLPNRRAWEARLHEATLGGEPVMLAMLDLDHFKDYNDTHGHPAGDRLLRETAAAWRDELRIGDFLARVGGEEFALLLPATSSQDAAVVVERLRVRVPCEQSCSAGIVTRRAQEDDESLMARADQALYASKAGGRDRVTVGA